uniref:RNA 3'-terminal phosphate cyclase domain-containing protein n=1 Tax=Buteo japonicus TaxID=224669 RepID=A0A8C0B5N7_9AVES
EKLRNYFIRLIDKVTNGSRIEINQTGTTLYYQPGLLHGGSLEHDCSPSRSIGYYLESLLCLAPFMKHPLKIVLRGVTNDQVDPSVTVAPFLHHTPNFLYCICLLSWKLPLNVMWGPATGLLLLFS